jgi:hypothetical protein
MSTLSGGPNIVVDGLVLALDAASTKSYMSGSIIWNDLSRNNNNGTLINGPTFNSNNGGSIVFDGTNDFVTGSIGSINTPFTFSVFGKFNNVFQTDYEYFGNIGSATTNGMISISKIGTRDINTAYHGFMYVYPGTGNVVRTNIDLRTTQYQYLTVVTTTTAPYVKVYKNGIEGLLIDTITGPINTNGTYRIGVWITTWWLNGNIANCSVYNRALSSQEILQNYNATKTRFGL